MFFTKVSEVLLTNQLLEPRSRFGVPRQMGWVVASVALAGADQLNGHSSRHLQPRGAYNVAPGRSMRWIFLRKVDGRPTLKEPPEFF